jgi:hypothetical protein
MSPDAINHPCTRLINFILLYSFSLSLTQTIPTGPAGIDRVKVEAIEGNKLIMLNAIPNTSKVEKFRFNSCLYPKCAATISVKSDI